MLSGERNYVVVMKGYAYVSHLMWILAKNFGEILRKSGEILGKYRILGGKSVGSKGLRLITQVIRVYCEKKNCVLTL